MILREWKVGACRVQVALCDITKEEVEAIVNAANSNLKHGGGVAWAIVKAGGYEIQRESDEYVQEHGPVPTGEVAVTSAGKLKAKYVIHAVGPIWRERGDEDALLYRAVFNTLKKAKELGVKSVAMPAISTGIYGFPKDRAAKIFGDAIRDFLQEEDFLELIRICHIDEGGARIFAENMEI